MMLVPTCDIEWHDYVVKAQETLKQDALSLSSGAARRSYADLLHGTFSSDEASFILLSEALSEMTALHEGWDSYGAPVPEPEAIATAVRALERLRSRLLLPEIITPSAEGGVSIYFSRGKQKALIEFLNEGEVLLARYGKDDEPNVKVLRNGLDDLNDQALQEIRNHLAARA
ncbi:MAG: hypothetical protein WBM24_21160 [Candidatus Sulfotelmatobacter sp.]